MKNKWGFLRETTASAIKAGIDKNTGLHRTGLEDYLRVIFPEVDDWIHDKTLGVVIDGKTCRSRPDYRSESLKLIIEFDGIQHYTKPDIIQNDVRNIATYQSLGYKVVRIPYFIQLSNAAVKTMFGVNVSEKLFDEGFPSLGIGPGSPAYLCPAGLERMAQDFKKFPSQYETNLKFLKEQNNPYLTGVNFLEHAYAQIE
jgi:hypothetical protein